MSTKKLGINVLIMGVLLLSAQVGFASEGRFSIGVSGGNVWSIEKSAVRNDYGGSGLNYFQTHFDNDQALEAHVGYLWNIFPDLLGGVEVMVENFDFRMDHRYPVIKYGELNITPIMLLLKLQTLPRHGTGLAVHFDVGAGVITSDFDENAGIEPIDTKESAAATVGGGLDLFVTKNIAVATSVRYLVGPVKHSWSRLGTNKLRIDNIQLLIGLQGYF